MFIKMFDLVGSISTVPNKQHEWPERVTLTRDQVFVKYKIL